MAQESLIEMEQRLQAQFPEKLVTLDNHSQVAWREAGDSGGDFAVVLLHGIYDSCAMIGTSRATMVFVVFVAVLYFSVYRLIRREARTDRPV